MAASNASLNKAHTERKDEFYTQLADIERELAHYDAHFRGKTVLCNCDDPYESNFFKYFAMNFNRLGIKKLIATCYYSSPIFGTEINLFDPDNEKEIRLTTKKSVQFRIANIPDMNGDGAISLEDAELLIQKRRPYRILKGDRKYPAGDFRSKECIELLKEADIVVTNPPFSLFREYVALLVKYEKSFLIIGSQNAIHYKEIFPLIRDNKMWLGYGFANGNAYFAVRDQRSYAKGVYDEKTGLVKFRNVTWFTNLDIQKRHEEMELWKPYNAEEYPTYDNYDAIEVGKTADIPKDYLGKMGVPDTFLYSYNPDQFELLGLSAGDMAKEIGITKNYRGRTDLAYTDKDGKNKCPYSRIVIRRRQHERENED